MRRLLCGAIAVGVLVFASPVMAEPARSGLQSLEVSATEAPPAVHEPDAVGPEDVQAGSHPYVLTTSFVVAKPEEYNILGVEPHYRPVNSGLKDFRLELPPGFVGNPNATPKCAYAAFVVKVCPDDTAVGEATTKILSPEAYQAAGTGEYRPQTITVSDAVYNIETPGGVPAEFGFLVKNATPVFVDASVRTGEDYGITVASRNIPQAALVAASTVKIWGVPGDPSHDRIRGECLGQGESLGSEEERTGVPHNEEESFCEAPGNLPVVPLLTNPTSCGVSRAAIASVDFWGEPGVFTSRAAVLPELSGCGRLDFSPTLTVVPDGGAGSTPTGLDVGVRVPQESVGNPVGLGEADVKDTTVVLPVGMQISPSAADGLEACSADPGDPPGTPGNEIGFTGFAELNPVSEPGVRTPQYSSRLPGSVAATEAGETEPLQPGKNFCPDASKIATVRIKTPLLEGELKGAVYLAAPQNFKGLPQNPFESLIAMYLVAEEPVTGVLVKLPGKVSLNETTGQITTTFENTPQTPFSSLELEFYGSARAPLATPALCGTYNTGALFVPWSGASPVQPVTSFQITSGPATVSEPNGAPCPGATLPFSPTLASGSTNINAGSFSNLTTTLGREDGQQLIQQVTLHYPPGLSGILSGVKLCGEAEANAGTCPAESEIGETIVSVGLGNDPFTVTGGKVYLTGPYQGAPFGLSIVNPAKAGPFILQEGRPVIVRAKIEVDPHTAALTVTTNTPAQGYAIPSVIEGVPLQIKHVNVNITRSGFTFNPTNCDPTQITGTVVSAEGVSSPVKVPFQVTNCQSLKFTPKFSVSTSGRTSKADGASLTTTVSEPNESQGSQANIAYVKVDLPKQLPSRLTTLQKACTAAQFNADPAGCPSASIIGHATVRTPLLPVPLEGPAYFVSNGGEAFPNLIMVLQGYGVTVDLVGDTFISKAGVTSTTFKAVPDQPFSSFELTLPEGPYSALAANGSLCALTTTKTVKKKVTVKVKGHRKTVTRKVKETVPAALQIPNEFIAQNGTVIRQDTPVSVTSCPRSVGKAKKAATAGKHKRTAKRKTSKQQQRR